jgi:hypothetical protein
MANKEKKKLSYIVEESSWIENLEKNVSEMMEKGYTPYGSISVVSDVKSPSRFSYFQPMILLKDKEEKKIL